MSNTTWLKSSRLIPLHASTATAKAVPSTNQIPLHQPRPANFRGNFLQPKNRFYNSASKKETLLDLDRSNSLEPLPSHPSESSLERLRRVKETHLYQRYLAEVAGLNQAKEYLGAHRDSMSVEVKRKLMGRILAVQKRLNDFENKELLQPTISNQ